MSEASSELWVPFGATSPSSVWSESRIDWVVQTVRLALSYRHCSQEAGRQLLVTDVSLLTTHGSIPKGSSP